MIPQILNPLRLAQRIAAGIARRLDTLDRQASPVQPGLSPHDEAVVRIMNQYDMVARPDEPYYAEQYLHFIRPEIERRFSQAPIKILDLGCGQGRLSLPLARWCADAGGAVTGVDLTAAAITQARQYAAAQGIRNVVFESGDAVEFVRARADGSADAVLFTEVTFFMPQYRQVLNELGRVLKPGGIAFIAFRSQYYNVLQLASLHRWESAKRCLTEREGYIFDGEMWHGWQTVEDVHALLRKVGLGVIRLYGIGVLSGIDIDARGAIIRPALLSPEDRKSLMELECAAAEQYAACGRYILTLAERPRGV